MSTWGNGHFHIHPITMRMRENELQNLSEEQFWQYAFKS